MLITTATRNFNCITSLNFGHGFHDIHAFSSRDNEHFCIFERRNIKMDWVQPIPYYAMVQISALKYNKLRRKKNATEKNRRERGEKQTMKKKTIQVLFRRREQKHKHNMRQL